MDGLFYPLKVKILGIVEVFGGLSLLAPKKCIGLNLGTIDISIQFC